ncbi:hypothetical protein SAMN06265365_12950 [Tistlia consotensis]|uniref:Uncharacterized protein n=1 Tax=Tistlia consotensis USBA 355 TaxID=560819 RepID=A0A1Y6CLT2_9PROT|nr:hypothetical protein [Tistlia consotensis]SMF75414.1 hypothetical protein SAMN05428998_13416 [Tistlia consotensis USBA 355]SNS08204.1 hypothetical protein SAMN06265365_12950 [Tistlia consotensis]
MALSIETYRNDRGGNAFFKAIGHPLAARRLPALRAALGRGPVAVYDPLGFAAGLAELYDLGDLEVAGFFVQDVETLDGGFAGCPAQPVTDLPGCRAATVFVTAFDAGRLVEQIRHLLPAGAEVVTLDTLRLPDALLTDPRNYLNGLNFATNFAFFRDSDDGQHTRIVSANYWGGYGAAAPRLWCCLFDHEGAVLAEWDQDLPAANAVFTIDSAEVRRRFGLSAFVGSLFLHVTGVRGHDVVKYALDTYGDAPEVLSCTHDANAWPSQWYAGLPAPKDGERVVLWIQNSHPCPVPAGAIGLNPMGRDEAVWLDRELPAFGTYALDVAEHLPGLRWPQQIEVMAGKHFVRPRYEIDTAQGRRRIAHMNVERSDLRPDPKIPELANLMGKGFLLPAPLLPTARFRTLVLPTPMARAQDDLPLGLLVFDREGKELAALSLGRLPRDHERLVDVTALLEEQGALAGLDGGYGHVELVYDFAEGGGADGWLHAIFRYEDRVSGHAAETSFGSHIFNSVLVYRNEPQSYASRPPGLSTRLFLRLGQAPYDTLCQLIYPASTPWHPQSSTTLALVDAQGREIASREIAIACGGSFLFRASETFEAAALAEAAGGYVLIRDRTCRLFGYHGLLSGEAAFSLDHMFGF